ncbi:Erythroblast NAD(P)(+)--arginine ADP-ribosyltransferase [Turdus rufiventris]|nr:Erythroblast NAD(P)(+)--arginine ADP-ribosyltransferase [Turdus rufiventris]
MTLLALTMALLVTTVATMDDEVVSLDMAPHSFDDQYQCCGSAMKVVLPTLNHSEFQKNSLFADIWLGSMEMWQRQGSPVSPLSSPDQAIAIMACTNLDMYEYFNDEVRVAGRSPQTFRDNFHYKTLHFLLTDALATLRATQGQKCRWVYRGRNYKRYKANVGDIVRFGHFVSSTLNKTLTERFVTSTLFQVQTCHGAYIKAFGYNPDEDEVLIPPYEKFKVTKVIKKREKVEIHLDSIETYSKYNCEWLKGGSIPRAPFHIAGLFLATTAMAVATGIL